MVGLLLTLTINKGIYICIYYVIIIYLLCLNRTPEDSSDDNSSDDGSSDNFECQYEKERRIRIQQNQNFLKETMKDVLPLKDSTPNKASVRNKCT